MFPYPHLVALSGTTLALAILCAVLAALLVHRHGAFLIAREAERAFRQLYENIGEGIFRVTVDGTLVSANPAFWHLHGYPGNGDGAGPTSANWYADPTRYAEVCDLLFTRGGVENLVSEIVRHGTGERRWVAENIRLVRDVRTGKPAYCDGTVRDVTDAFRRLEMQARHDKIAAIVPGCLYQCRLSPDGKSTMPYASVGIAGLFGLTPEEVVSDASRVLGLIHPDDRDVVYQSVHRSAETLQPWRCEYRIRTVDGAEKWVLAHAIAEREADGSVLWHGFMTDITERKQAESRIYDLAYLDTLTGLPNRTVLVDRLQQTLTAPGPQPRWNALLFIDLDQFKVLNDTKGHHLGDRLLSELAARLRGVVGRDDLVARFGGDEFVILLRELAIVPEVAQQQVGRLVDRLHAAIVEPFVLDGFPFRTSASIGIALFRGNEIGVDEILKRADLAMYEAKAAGYGTASFFAANMQAVLEERLTLTTELREAIEEGSLMVYYQPQVDDGGEVFGVEALLRWNHPQRGLIPPAVFIPLAERAGLGEQINAFVIGSACATLARWAEHPGLDQLQMAVNVGGRRLGQDLVDIITDALALSGVDPERLTIELTEQVMLDNVAELDTALAGLKRLGIKIFLDDFGTGYSSLSHLRRLPIDALKVDCSFVRDIETDQNDRVIVQTILNIGRNLGLSVVAEGVENEMQGLLLRRFGCRAFQGFLYGKPMPLEEFEERQTAAPAQPQRAAVMAPSRLVV